MKKTLVIAHRGASGTTRENTLEAFDRAINLKADMIELDVNITKDRKFVIFHDYALDRLTNLKGNLIDYTLTQIKKSDKKIITLEKCIGFFKNKKIKLNVEIKGKLEGHEKEIYFFLKGHKNKIVVSSLNLKILKTMRKIDPKLKLGVLFTKPQNKFIDFAKKIKAYSLHPYKLALNKKIIYEAQKNNIKVYVWVVNNKTTMKHFIKQGVDGIMTDYPERLKEVLDENTKSSN